MSTSNPSGEGLFTDLTGRTARLMVYSLLAIILMALDHRGRYVDDLRDALGNLAEPAHRVVQMPASAAAWLRDYVGSRRDLRQRLRELESERLVAEAELSRIAELAAENAELRAVVQASRRIDADYLPAELMRVSLNPFAHQIVINRGRRHGVTVGQPVIDAGGVLGQVSAVTHGTARVTLISDPNHALPVMLYRTGMRTIAYGTGRGGQLVLPDVPMNADLREGDLVFTSGLDGRFPAGLPVAEISTVTRRPGDAFARAQALPLGHLDRSRHVLLLILPEEADLAEEVLEESPETPLEESAEQALDPPETGPAPDTGDSPEETGEGGPT